QQPTRLYSLPTYPARGPAARADRAPRRSSSSDERLARVGRARFNGVDDLANERIDVDALGLALEVEDHAMAERRSSERLEVVRAHVVTALGQRAHLGAENQRLCATRAGPVAHEASREVGSVGPLRMRGHHDARGEIADVGRPRPLANQLAKRDPLGATHPPVARALP